MRKNSHIHFTIETPELEILRIEAEERKITLSELCRVKLRKESQLNRIEKKLDKILENI